MREKIFIFISKIARQKLDAGRGVRAVWRGSRAARKPAIGPNRMYTILGSDQQQYGPVDEAAVIQWIQSGQANAATMIHKEGAPDWAAVASGRRTCRHPHSSTESVWYIEHPVWRNLWRLLGVWHFCKLGGARFGVR
jgi:hypothetical protein